jgi:hypothetical protein
LLERYSPVLKGMGQSALIHLTYGEISLDESAEDRPHSQVWSTLDGTRIWVADRQMHRHRVQYVACDSEVCHMFTQGLK